MLEDNSKMLSSADKAVAMLYNIRDVCKAAVDGEDLNELLKKVASWKTLHPELTKPRSCQQCGVRDNRITELEAFVKNLKTQLAGRTVELVNVSERAAKAEAALTNESAAKLSTMEVALRESDDKNKRDQATILALQASLARSEEKERKSMGAMQAMATQVSMVNSLRDQLTAAVMDKSQMSGVINAKSEEASVLREALAAVQDQQRRDADDRARDTEEFRKMYAEMEETVYSQAADIKRLNEELQNSEALLSSTEQRLSVTEQRLSIIETAEGGARQPTPEAAVPFWDKTDIEINGDDIVGTEEVKERYHSAMTLMWQRTNLAPFEAAAELEEELNGESHTATEEHEEHEHEHECVPEEEVYEEHIDEDGLQTISEGEEEDSEGEEENSHTLMAVPSPRRPIPLPLSNDEYKDNDSYGYTDDFETSEDQHSQNYNINSGHAYTGHTSTNGVHSIEQERGSFSSADTSNSRRAMENGERSAERSTTYEQQDGTVDGTMERLYGRADERSSPAGSISDAEAEEEQQQEEERYAEQERYEEQRTSTSTSTYRAGADERYAEQERYEEQGTSTSTSNYRAGAGERMSTLSAALGHSASDSELSPLPTHASALTFNSSSGSSASSKDYLQNNSVASSPRLTSHMQSGSPSLSSTRSRAMAAGKLKRGRTHLRAPSDVPTPTFDASRGHFAALTTSEDRDALVILEMGSTKLRVGIVDMSGGSASAFDEFPNCLARPKNKKTDPLAMVNMASTISAKMYKNFRETGVFVGADAYYCCMDHPDAGLRSKLNITCPLTRGHILKENEDDVAIMWEYAFKNLQADSMCTPIIITYSPTYSKQEVSALACLACERLQSPTIRLVNEATLIAMQAKIRTGAVVMIGETTISVCPIFEGCFLKDNMRTDQVGGKDVDTFLDYMLLSRHQEDYNQMVDRRRHNYSKTIKEEHCYVAENFESEQDKHGVFQRKSVRVIAGTQVAPKIPGYVPISSEAFYEEETKDEPVEIEITQKNGNILKMKVGLERFHAPEILFTPGIWEESESTDGLVGLVVQSVLSCDPDLWEPMLGNIVIHGNSGLLPGVADRLLVGLIGELPEHLLDCPYIRVLAEEAAEKGDVQALTSSERRIIPSHVMLGAEKLFQLERNCDLSWIKLSEFEAESDVEPAKRKAITKQFYYSAD